MTDHGKREGTRRSRITFLMGRWLVALAGIVGFVSTAKAVVTVLLVDEFDDLELVFAAYDQEAVKASRKELDEFGQKLLVTKQDEIEKLLGKPAKKPEKTYAMPVAQPRGFTMSGIRYADEKLNKDHTDFFPIADVGGIEVWYGIDGKSPVAVIIYLKVDKTFPKLTDKNLKERLAWDGERFEKMVRIIEERKQKR